MGRGIKLSESDIKNNVIKKINTLDYAVELVDIEYENNYIKASNAILLLKCPEHNRIERVKYYNFINWGWHCDECNIINNRSNKPEIECRIKEILDKSNQLGTDLELIKFCDDDWSGYSTSGAKVEIKCNKHDIITTPRISNILRNNTDNDYKLFCPECRKEYGLPSHRTDPKLAEEALEKKFPNSIYDFSKVAETYETLESEVTIICPNHGEFTRPYKYLINSGDPRCPKCYEEHLISRVRSDGINSLISRDDAIKFIEELIIEKNKYPEVDIEFIGFVDDKWIGSKTNLILRCRKHNIIWTETTYSTLRKSNTYLVCPICRIEQATSIGENLCWEKLLSMSISATRQFEISVLQKEISSIIYLDLFMLISIFRLWM